MAERGARKGRNPATGESITIKASKTVRFKAGKELKEAVNTKKRGALEPSSQRSRQRLLAASRAARGRSKLQGASQAHRMCR